MGDPAGIGPELALAAASDPSILKECEPLLVGDPEALAHWSKLVSLPVPPMVIDARATAGPIAPGKPTSAGADAALKSVMTAARLCLTGEADAMVTSPVSKLAITEAGYDFTGHTEFLADLTSADHFLMTFVHGTKRVALVTTHLALSDVPRVLTTDLVTDKIATLNRGLNGWFGIDDPVVAVTALNPHAGEGGSFGDEEERIISPAIADARESGINVDGPFPADTIFCGHGGPSSGGPGSGYDAILTMYHDQGTIAAKLWGFGECVNVTLGLPIVRTSVDHGTAFEIAGRGVACRGSMLAAIRLAADIARKRVNRLDGASSGSLE